jgi:hypothetical protein
MRLVSAEGGIVQAALIVGSLVGGLLLLWMALQFVANAEQVIDGVLNPDVILRS